MQSRLIPIACCLALLAGAASAQTNVYRWVDKDGKVHFSDTPPPLDAKSSAQKRLGGGYVDQEHPYATQQAMKRNPVVLYTAPSCGDACVNARAMLSQRGIPFGERDVQASVPAQDALKKLIGTLYVPVLVVGASHFQGYEEEQWNGALDTAGYPRTRAPGQSPTRPVLEAAPPAKAPEPTAAAQPGPK
jgi:glutaredoxin